MQYQSSLPLDGLQLFGQLLSILVQYQLLCGQHSLYYQYLHLANWELERCTILFWCFHFLTLRNDTSSSDIFVILIFLRLRTAISKLSRLLIACLRVSVFWLASLFTVAPTPSTGPLLWLVALQFQIMSVSCFLKTNLMIPLHIYF